MAIMPPDVIEPPMPRPLRYGLFAAVGALLPLTDHQSGGGLIYEPNTCGIAHSWPMDCEDDSPADESPAEKVFDEIPAFVEAEPFVVYGSSTCGSLGTSAAKSERRARQNLENGEQFEVESAMAAVLASQDVALGNEVLVAGAVAELEQWLYGTAAYGREGFIHASPGVAALAAAEMQWERDGSRYRTPYGTIWSVGGGYPEGTIFISGEARVWRSDIEVPDPVQTFDRATNQWFTVAERVYAVAVECAVASVTLGA
jgi:hypothetical protein